MRKQWLCSVFFDGSLSNVSYELCPNTGISDETDLRKMTRVKRIKVSSSLISLVILLSVLSAACGFSECGDYYYITEGMTGVLNSPDYPAMYPTYSRCIWLIQTSANNLRVRLTLSYTGERYNGTCSDYIEIRQGSQYAPLIGTYCDSAVNEVITSDYIWMWILFKSDGLTGSSSVMTATFTTFQNDTPSSNTTKPYSDCRSYEFECRNKMCASLSYRCDGYNDCGCKEDCDEDACWTLSIGKGAQIGISVGVGVFTFLIVCLMSFLLEGQHSWTTTLAEAKREQENQEEARRRRVSRAFSKFIGSENNFSRGTDTSFNALRAPQPGSTTLKGPLATLTVQPKTVPAFKVSDMTVTDIEA